MTGWVVSNNRTEIEELVEKYNLTITSTKGIFNYLSGDKDSFMQFEKENQRYVMNYR